MNSPQSLTNQANAIFIAPGEQHVYAHKLWRFLEDDNSLIKNRTLSKLWRLISF
jgi:hypothetical protein